MLPVAPLILVFLATTLAVWLLGDLVAHWGTRRRLMALAGSDYDRARVEGGLGRLKPLLQDLVAVLEENRVAGGRLAMADARYARLLAQAGNPGALNGREFFVLKLAAPVVVFLVVFSVLRGDLLWLNVLVAAGAFWLPDNWLRDQQRQRVAAILHGLPDAMDTFALTMSAGLDFGQAIDAFIDDPQRTALMEEFYLMRAEMRVGKTRTQAFESMARRVALPELSNLATAVNQAERTGVSLADYLASQAEELRGVMFQYAEERGQKAPVKMMAPLMLFVMPCVFFVLIGPMIINYLNQP